jgi:hypothetical protein
LCVPCTDSVGGGVRPLVFRVWARLCIPSQPKRLHSSRTGPFAPASCLCLQQRVSHTVRGPPVPSCTCPLVWDCWTFSTPCTCTQHLNLSFMLVPLSLCHLLTFHSTHCLHVRAAFHSRGLCVCVVGLACLGVFCLPCCLQAAAPLWLLAA